MILNNLRGALTAINREKTGYIVLAPHDTVYYSLLGQLKDPKVDYVLARYKGKRVTDADVLQAYMDYASGCM